MADKIARRLDEQGIARMVSFAGLSSNIFEGSKAALSSRLIVIDGCHSECAKNAMAAVGFDNCQCVDLMGAGIIEAGSVPSDEHLERGVEHIRQLLRTGGRNPSE